MALRSRAIEPGKPGRGVRRDAVPVEQDLPIQRLRLRLAVLRERMKKGRALRGVVRNARGRCDGWGGGIRRQNLNSTDPKIVRPVEIAA